MVVSSRYDPHPRVHKEAVSLVQRGHRVIVYAFDRQWEMTPLETTIDGVEVRRLRFRRSTYNNVFHVVRDLPAFNREVRKRLLQDPPDVVHCNDQDTCPVGYWWKYHGAKNTQKDRNGLGRFVFDVHDLYWTHLLRSNLQLPIRFIGGSALKIRDRFFAKSADLLITVSEGVGKIPGFAEIYRDWGCNPLIIWNAPPRPESIPSLPSNFTIGYFGFIRHTDMFQWLIDAIERLPPEHRPDVRLAGSGIEEEKVKSMFLSAAKNLNFSANITGRFEMPQLGDLMSQCSVQYCLYPTGRGGNTDRTIPVKLFDSVAYRRPVIGNADTLMGEWISNNGWGWQVADGDVIGLAKAIQSAMNEASSRQNKLPELNPPPFWDEQGKRLVEAYERLLQ